MAYKSNISRDNYSRHPFVPLSLAHFFTNTTTKMADLGKRKRRDSDELTTERIMRTPGLQSQPESQQSDATLNFEPSDADEILRSVLDTLPPVHQWSGATIKSLRSAVSEKDPKAEWQDESEWTRRVINAILASNEGWNWQRLKTCSNADYFSLPIYVSHKFNSCTVPCHCPDSGFHIK